MRRADGARPDPTSAALARLLDPLFEGDPGPLSAWLRVGAPGLADAQRLLWELSTLYGRHVGRLWVAAGDERFEYGIQHLIVMTTGHPERWVADPRALADEWLAALAEPPTRAVHRRGMAETLAAARRDTHPDPDSAFCLLRHHTDRPVDAWFAPASARPTFSRGERISAHLGEFAELAEALGSEAAFDRLVEAGLASPSRPRRDLCWRLSRLPAR